MNNQISAVTADMVIAILDSLYAEFSRLIEQVPLDAPPPAEGEWSVRQVLSHVLGSLNRAPLQAGFFLAGAAEVPITFHDPYWIETYATAPKPSFQAGLLAAVEGNKAFVRGLTPDALDIAMQASGMSLGTFLVVCYQKHVVEQHLHQLRAFVPDAAQV
jgi:hypothetical protein